MMPEQPSEKVLVACTLITKPWTVLILRALLSGARRRMEIHQFVPDINARTLGKRLCDLELAGIIERIVHPDVPVRIEYEVTRKGESLEPLIRAFEEWAEEWTTVSVH